MKVSIPILILLLCSSACVSAQQKTQINDPAAARMLLGRHMLSLQWISWNYFGTATVEIESGLYRLRGEQKGRGGSTNNLKIDGLIFQIDAREFKFSGTIVTQIDHINGGEPCRREGEYTFRITGKRKYWRLQEMDNPCDEATDYVDLYFR